MGTSARLRHERQSIVMALMEAQHHSAPKVRAVPYNAPRSQMAARAVVARPGVLQDPEPQGRAVTDGYVSAPVPSVAPRVLAAPAAEAVHSRTLSFLLDGALVEKEKRRKRELEELAARVRAVGPAAWRHSSSSAGKKRKRKKRRKKRLPRSSSSTCRCPTTGRISGSRRLDHLSVSFCVGVSLSSVLEQYQVVRPSR